MTITSKLILIRHLVKRKNNHQYLIIDTTDSGVSIVTKVKIGSSVSLGPFFHKLF